MNFIALAILLFAAATTTLVFAADDVDECSDTNIPDYLIIGAGGAGIQTALFLLRSPQTSSFTILEKSNTVGSFWTRFPRFDELISINKSVRNETQRYRYDWHSFLESDLGMMNVTEDYFPKGKDWHRYMERVVEETPGLKERIEYGVEVEQLIVEEEGHDNNMHCVQIKGGNKRCALRRIFVATGLRTKDEPYLRALGGIPYAEATKQQAKHKRVCILGNGNSAFELAQNLYNVADRVTLYGRSPHRLSAVTRYTGDVRVKYLQVLENLNGKLLDTVDHFSSWPELRGEEKLPLTPAQLHELKELVRTAAWLDQFECEAFFYATGVQSVVPGEVMNQGNLFPKTGDWYTDVRNPNIHYIGWLMHERDFRKGAGGFFSGFRYLIRNLIQHVLLEDYGVEYPYHVFTTKEEVVQHAVKRIQIADDLIILQDGRVLRDAVLKVEVESGGTHYHYYEGVTFNFMDEFKNRDDVMFVFMAWGNGKTSSHVFDGVWRYSDTGTLINLFLHPVVLVGNLSRDMHEDLEMAWTDPAYVISIENVMKEALDGRLDKFSDEHSSSYAWKRSIINQTEDPGYYESAPLVSGIDNRVFQDLWKAIYRKGAVREMTTLTNSMKKWQPSLFETTNP